MSGCCGVCGGQSPEEVKDTEVVQQQEVEEQAQETAEEQA